MSDNPKFSKPVHNLVIYFFVFAIGWSVLLNGSAFVAIEGRHAIELKVDWSDYIPYTPWVALSVYIFGLVAVFLRKSKVYRYSVFGVFTILAHLVKYGIAYTHYSSSVEGAVVVVRRDDYSKELEDFIQDTAKNQLHNK